MTTKMKKLFAGVGFMTLIAGIAAAQGIRFKDHDETTAGTLTLVPADVTPPGRNDIVL